MPVYVASMNLRGSWAETPKDWRRLNVTSAQRKESAERRCFSPMTEIEGGYKGFWCFENYWQSGKVFEDVPHSVSLKWWRDLKRPARRYPNSKGKRVLYSLFNGEKMDYITARRKVYLPEYLALIQGQGTAQIWRARADQGETIVIYDFDGPRQSDHSPICLEVSREMLRERLNDPTHPFGHGYIVAGYMARVINEPSDLTEAKSGSERDALVETDALVELDTLVET